MEDIFDFLSDIIDDSDDVLDVVDTDSDFEEVLSSFDHSSVVEGLHSDNMLDNFREFSETHSISFHGKSVDELSDLHKTISVNSAGGGPSYTLDVYKDEYGKVWVAKHNSSIAECISGKSQVTLGQHFSTQDIKSKLKI